MLSAITFLVIRRDLLYLSSVYSRSPAFRPSDSALHFFDFDWEEQDKYNFSDALQRCHHFK
jgi:hypothetical protein